MWRTWSLPITVKNKFYPWVIQISAVVSFSGSFSHICTQIQSKNSILDFHWDIHSYQALHSYLGLMELLGKKDVHGATLYCFIYPLSLSNLSLLLLSPPPSCTCVCIHIHVQTQYVYTYIYTYTCNISSKIVLNQYF